MRLELLALWLAVVAVDVSSALAEAPATVLTSVCGTGKTFEKDGRLVCEKCANLPASVKRHPIQGKAADLPEGFFVYTHGGYRHTNDDGLLISPIRSFVPRPIPGTENAWRFAISGSGQWIVFMQGKANPRAKKGQISGPYEAFLIRPDGSAKTRLPLSDPVEYVGFVYDSPAGSQEVFYCDRGGKLYGLAVDLSGPRPVFRGQPRLISNVPFTNAHDRQVGISGSHIFGNPQGMGRSTAAWVTVPDAGKGIAEMNDVWAPKGGWPWQCGCSLSHDGRLVCINPGGADPWFDRILILPFKGPSEASYGDYKAFYRKEAVSWNCPPVVNGNADIGLFHYHSFTSSSEHIITRRQAPKADASSREGGIYVLHWPSNTWTLISDPRTQAANVEAHFFEKGQKPSTPFGAGEALSYDRAPERPATAKPAAQPAPQVLELEATITHLEAVPDPKEIVYTKAVTYIQYRVDKVVSGTYGKKDIVIGHWALLDSKLSAAAQYRVGDRQRIRCEQMNAMGRHADIASEQSLDASKAPDLERYWALSVQPLPARQAE